MVLCNAKLYKVEKVPILNTSQADRGRPTNFPLNQYCALDAWKPWHNKGHSHHSSIST